MGFVYFVQAGKSGPIKIGYSANLRSRLTNLQLWTPWKLRLLAAIPGSMRGEVCAQSRFHSIRIQGEWFKPSRDLRDYIQEAILAQRVPGEPAPKPAPDPFRSKRISAGHRRRRERLQAEAIARTRDNPPADKTADGAAA